MISTQERKQRDGTQHQLNERPTCLSCVTADAERQHEPLQPGSGEPGVPRPQQPSG